MTQVMIGLCVARYANLLSMGTYCRSEYFLPKSKIIVVNIQNFLHFSCYQREIFIKKNLVKVVSIILYSTSSMCYLLSQTAWNKWKNAKTHALIEWSMLGSAMIVLIVLNWVLTAAQCVYEFLDPSLRRKKWYLVTCFFLYRLKYWECFLTYAVCYASFLHHFCFCSCLFFVTVFKLPSNKAVVIASRFIVLQGGKSS